MNKRLIKNVLVTGCVLVILAGRAFAAGDGYEAPEIDDATPWAGILLAVASLIGVAFAAFHNAKRSHLEED